MSAEILGTRSISQDGFFTQPIVQDIYKLERYSSILSQLISIRDSLTLLTPRVGVRLSESGSGKVELTYYPNGVMITMNDTLDLLSAIAEHLEGNGHE